MSRTTFGAIPPKPVQKYRLARMCSPARIASGSFHVSRRALVAYSIKEAALESACRRVGRVVSLTEYLSLASLSSQDRLASFIALNA